MILVYIYLLAVVLANMIILWFGPQAAVITAFYLLVLILLYVTNCMINGMGNNCAGTVCRKIRRGLFVVTCTAKIF